MYFYVCAKFKILKYLLKYLWYLLRVLKIIVNSYKEYIEKDIFLLVVYHLK